MNKFPYEKHRFDSNTVYYQDKNSFVIQMDDSQS